MTAMNSAIGQVDRVAGRTGAAPSCSVAQSLLAEFEHELKTTRKFFERIPAGRLTWRPHEKSMTVGQLALHIAQVPFGVLTLSLPDQGKAPDVGGDRLQPATMQDVFDTLDRTATFVRQTLPNLSDARMHSTFKVTAPDSEEVLMAGPRAEFLRAIMLNHWYHHRGQLGVYLRLLGAVVPPSYGPSGDESPF